MNIKKLIPKDILIILILAVILNITRVILFNSHSFVWLLWNILLAIIPFVISLILLWLANQGKLKQAIFIIGLLFWLVFIPNAPYIVTDLKHIGVVRSVPALYDAFLLFSSAWVGLYLGLYSISHIEKILRLKYSKVVSEITIFIFILFISMGIYLGRFLRFNSWDLFKEPLPILKTVHQTFFSFSGRIEEYLYVILFTLFLYMFYRAFKYTKKTGL